MPLGARRDVMKIGRLVVAAITFKLRCGECGQDYVKTTPTGEEPYFFAM
jgi:hypothetical protein